jgi:dTDP-4-dehydrorhamnose 3,5-epimerase
MKLTPTPLEGAYLIDLEKRGDERGFFARYFCKKEFSEASLNSDWVQINNSYSSEKGTLRGLHFQRQPASEVKLVRCIQGSIWDVIVDIRPTSPTYKGWFGTELSQDNRTMMYVPQGFAHGFISLTDDSEIIYLVSNFYDSSHERNLKWNDLDVAIEWPILPTVISERDSKAPSLIELEPYC